MLWAGAQPPHWRGWRRKLSNICMYHMSSHISVTQYFLAPEYSVLKVLLLETEFGGRGWGVGYRLYVSIRTYIHTYIEWEGKGWGVRVGANNAI